MVCSVYSYIALLKRNVTLPYSDIFKLLWSKECGECDFLSQLQLPSQVMWSGEKSGFSVFQLQVLYELVTHSDKSGFIHHENKLTVKCTLMHIFKNPITGSHSLICDRIH